MADDKSKRGSPDNKRLSKGEPYEVAYARKKAKASSGGSTGRTAAKRAGPAARKSGTRSGSARAAAAPAARKRTAPKEAVRTTPRPPTEKRTPENTAPRTMKAADAVDLLTDDHLQVSALFKQYEKLAKKKAPTEQRRSLAGTICAMLTSHSTVEEEIFYPAARRARIESGDPGDDHYDARVKVLGEYIAHHVVEEHVEMFPKCRRAGMDLVALRERMQARKAELESGGTAIAEEGVPMPMAASAESPGILSRISDSLFTARNP